MLHTPNDRGETPALYAILQRRAPAFLDRLVAAAGGADAALHGQTTNADGWTPLHCAAAAGSGELVAHLVGAYGLDPDVPLELPQPGRNREDEHDDDDDDDDDNHDHEHEHEHEQPRQGDTPAHVAARAHSADAFRALYEAGADCRMRRNGAGETAFDVVRRAGAREIIEFLDRTPVLAAEEEKEEEEEDKEDGESDASSSLLEEITEPSDDGIIDEDGDDGNGNGGNDDRGRQGGWKRQECSWLRDARNGVFRRWWVFGGRP